MQLLGWGSSVSDYNSFQIMIFTLQHRTFSQWSSHTLKKVSFYLLFIFFIFHFFIIYFHFSDFSFLFTHHCMFAYVYSSILWFFSKSLKVFLSQLFVCTLQMFKLVQYSYFLKKIIDISNWSLITIVCS